MKSDENVIAICESDQQVEWLITQQQYSDKITHWIAANPSAYWELKHRNVSFSRLEDFQINKSSEKIESLQSDQVQWACNVDAFLQKRLSDFNSTNFCPARNYLVYLKNAWDTLINRADLLENITKRVGSNKLVYFYTNNPSQYFSDFTRSGSALSKCIPLWADHYGIPLIPLPDISSDSIWKPQVQMKTGIRRKITSKIPRFLIHHIQWIINKPVFPLLPLRVQLSEKKKIILVKSLYDITDEISHQLCIYGVNPQSFDIAVARSQKCSIPLPSLYQNLTEAWQQIIDLEWFWKPNGWQDWSLRTELEPLFHHFWFSILPELWKSFTGSRSYIQKHFPYAVFVPSIWGTGETGFIMAAHHEQVPVFFYQHGACMGEIENTIWDLTDSIYGDYQFIYGEGSANYIRSRNRSSFSRAMPYHVGSARLDRIAQGISKKKEITLRRSILGEKEVPLIVYVPGTFFNNYFRYDYQDFRHCRIFDLRCDVAKIFHKLPNVQFSYKAFVSEGSDPTLEMLKETCPGCSIIDNISLTDLQWIADLIIHEIPGTGMYEGLVTNKPMIVHVDREIYKMPNQVKDLLKKRVDITETTPELIDTVIQFLNLHNFAPISNPNREFIKAFCTYLDDGQSAHRVADAIFTLAQKKSSP